MSDDKDLPPSETKLAKGLDENQDEQSAEINQLVTVFVIGGACYTLLLNLVGPLRRLLDSERLSAIDLDDPPQLVSHAFGTILPMAISGVSILLGLSLFSGFVGNILNRRRPPSMKMPELSYNPMSSAQGLVKPSKLLTTLKVWVFSLVMFGWTGFIAYRQLPAAASGVFADSMGAASVAVRLLIFALPVVVGLAVLSAILDAVQKHADFVKSNMMDQEEVKKESKEENGDPEIKAKRNEIMRGG